MDHCGWALPSEGCICDKPAVGVYVGLGGSQPVCAEHAEWLRQRWGIKVRPLEENAR